VRKYVWRYIFECWKVSCEKKYTKGYLGVDRKYPDEKSGFIDTY